MLKKLLVLLLSCVSIIGIGHQTNTAFAYNSVNYPPIQNEKFVVLALRTLNSAEATYQATSGNGNYGSLNNLRQAEFIDAVLASGKKYGYIFVVQTTARTNTSGARYFITATPQSYRKTGRKSFYIDETGVMRGTDKNGAPATANDPIFENECLRNEECTISKMRTLASTEKTYQSSSGNGNYGTINQLYAASLIDELLARGYANGYNFAITTVDRTTDSPASFKVTAVPINYGVTGIRSFYIDETEVIRGADKNGAPATGDDPPIE